MRTQAQPLRPLCVLEAVLPVRTIPTSAVTRRPHG